MLITAGKGFALLAALKPTSSAHRHRPFRLLGCWNMYPAMHGDTYLPPLVTIYCS